MSSPPARIQTIQTCSHLLMVRPHAFGFNRQTAESNGFQTVPTSRSDSDIQQLAIEEFDTFISILQAHQIEVTVFEDLEEPVTTDAVFPNNWISFHQNGKIFLYPMMAPIRRLERRQDIVEHFAGQHSQAEIIDLSHFEDQGLFLEGTGSMIMDRVQQRVYACVSPRTSSELFHRFCEEVDCEGFLFHAVDEQGLAIYHTNVMMALGEKVVVICLESIQDEKERDTLTAHLQHSGHEIVPISFHQMNQFAGNMMEVRNQVGKPYMILSQRAYDSLHVAQKNQIAAHAQLLPIPIDVIETYGGGSVRCMMAEVFI